MELIKSNIHMNKIIRNEVKTFFVNREERITEANPEIGNIINQKEMVTVDSVILRNNQVIVNGTISYSILYYPDGEESISGIEGEIPFEEIIKIADVSEEYNADVRLVILSSNVKLLDSTNYIYKIQMMAYVTIKKMEDLEMAVATNNSDAMLHHKDIDGLSVVADKTDTYRVNDRISVPSGKPEIGRIVWKDIKLKNISTNLMNGMLHIGGEIYVFVLYTPESENAPQQWIETSLNFGGTIEISEATEDMISYIWTDLQNINVEAVLNQDNENRNLDISAVLKLYIKLFEEKKMEIIDDIYSPKINFVPKTESRTFEKLLVKNASRTKNTVKLSVDPAKGHILQVCNSGAELKIDNVIVSDNGLKTIGKLRVYVIYISSDDMKPVCCLWKELDFEHRIDADGISQNDKYYINWRVEQVSANMLSTNEIEIKAVIALEAIVFKEENAMFITSVDESAINMEAVNAAPVLKGYIVQPGDTLWKLAKENYTTIESIMQVNELQNQQIKSGDRLLIVKSTV